MDSEMIIPYLFRWVHIASATLTIGGAFFIRFLLMPAAGRVLDADTHDKLREAINARWRVIVYILITLFLITGVYNFLAPTRVHGVLVTGRWRDFTPEDKRLYHMLFGIKVLAAFGMFFLASALPGRTATFAPIRKNARMWLLVFLLLAAIVLSCSTGLRYLPRPQAGVTVNVNVPGLTQ
jgi:hypothetical protein